MQKPILIQGDKKRENRATLEVSDRGFRYAVEPGWAQFPEPWKSCAVVSGCCDAQDNLYISTRVPEAPVMVFAPDGAYLRSFGSGLLRRPHGLAISQANTLLLTDDSAHVVYELSLQGNVLRTFGQLDKPSDSGYDISITDPDERLASIIRAAEPFNRPTQMIQVPNGKYFVSDGYGNAAIHRFSAEGKYELTWGAPGRGVGQLRIPHGLCADLLDRIWVANRENNKIEVYTQDGDLLAEFADLCYRPAELWCDGTYMYVGEVDGGLTIIDLDCRIAAQMGYYWSPLLAHGLTGNSQSDLFLFTLSLSKGSNLLKLKRL